jgi:hypothetical protein
MITDRAFDVAKLAQLPTGASVKITKLTGRDVIAELHHNKVPAEDLEKTFWRVTFSCPCPDGNKEMRLDGCSPFLGPITEATLDQFLAAVKEHALV